MAKFKYHKISNSKKIRYILKVYRDSQFVVFLDGFMSDLEGKKPKDIKLTKRETKHLSILQRQILQAKENGLSDSQIKTLAFVMLGIALMIMILFRSLFIMSIYFMKSLELFVKTLSVLSISDPILSIFPFSHFPVFPFLRLSVLQFNHFCFSVFP